MCVLVAWDMKFLGIDCPYIWVFSCESIVLDADDNCSILFYRRNHETVSVNYNY